MYKYLLNSNLSVKIFFLGIFLLPSAPLISIFFLLISSFNSIKQNFTKIINDKWNFTFILSALLMPLICLLQSENIKPLIDRWDKSLTWIGLSNWLPLIFIFLSFQFFVSTAEDRKIVSKVLVAGSLPILISGFAQYFFKIYGPFDIFNGLIIWFQRPLQTDTGMSAVFNNQNYAGSWFCIIWPLSLAALLDSFNKKVNKFICLSILISITTAVIITTSRSAWGGLILLVPLMTGLSFLPYFLPIIFFGIVCIFIANANLVPSDLQNFIRDIIPNRFWQEFNPENFIARESRIDIWGKALIFISQKPIFGWGAATFPILYFLETEAYAGHAHNLILELANNYGIPITIIIFGSIILICFNSFFKIYINESYTKIQFFERAWFSSFFVLLISQLWDIQYFDGRISIVFWILLAGLKEVITSKEQLGNTSL